MDSNIPKQVNLMPNSTVNRLDLPVIQDKGSVAEDVVGHRLDLVEHVEVKLTIGLGSAELPIGELFQLGSGRVIELDRDVDAPVDVLLNGRVIARGHLVAVGDRFGVQIAEICG